MIWKSLIMEFNDWKKIDFKDFGLSRIRQEFSKRNLPKKIISTI